MTSLINNLNDRRGQINFQILCITAKLQFPLFKNSDIYSCFSNLNDALTSTCVLPLFFY